MSQTERLYWIDGQIRNRRYPNADTVCHQFGVSRRTAFDDRNHLSNHLGAPLAYDRRRGGWTYTDPTYLLPFLALTEREAATLRRSLLAAQEYLAPPDAGTVNALAQRLQPFLPTLMEKASETMSGAIQPATGISASAALMDECRLAIQERRCLRLLYYSAHRNEVRERVVQPYHLHHWRGEPYLIAWCQWRQDFRDFFLSRVREWELLAPADAFTRDPDFDVEAYRQRGFALHRGEALVTVRVRFSPYQARWVRERLYHPSQQCTEARDGSLEMTLAVAGTFEIKRWLLGYGADVEVLEPLSLRAEMAEEAKKLSDIYAAR